MKCCNDQDFQDRLALFLYAEKRTLRMRLACSKRARIMRALATLVLFIAQLWHPSLATERNAGQLSTQASARFPVTAINTLFNNSAMQISDSHLPDMVRFSPAVPGSLAAGRFHCVGTLLSEDTLLTAAHCIEDSISNLVLDCRLGKTGSMRRIVPIRRRVVHEWVDIAIVQWNTHAPCIPGARAATLADSAGINPLFSVMTEQPQHNGGHFTVGIVSADQLTFRVEGSHACLQQSHSGYPFFRQSADGSTMLEAMLISGNDDCPSTQLLVRLTGVHAWLQETLKHL